MHEMTAANLRSAHGGESMAHMRYMVWGAKARDEKFPNVARLFEAVSFAEQVHGSGHFQTLSTVKGDHPVTAMAGFGVGSTADNLAGAIAGELYEVNEMYPAFRQVAQAQGEKNADRTFHFAEEAEKQHAALYTRARESVLTGKDIALGTIQVCSVCGHTIEGEAPDKCPVCMAKKERFRAFA